MDSDDGDSEGDSSDEDDSDDESDSGSDGEDVDFPSRKQKAGDGERVAPLISTKNPREDTKTSTARMKRSEDEEDDNEGLGRGASKWKEMMQGYKREKTLMELIYDDTDGHDARRARE